MKKRVNKTYYEVSFYNKSIRMNVHDKETIGSAMLLLKDGIGGHIDQIQVYKIHVEETNQSHTLIYEMKKIKGRWTQTAPQNKEY